jgi:hypothetical protein
MQSILNFPKSLKYDFFKRKFFFQFKTQLRFTHYIWSLYLTTPLF